MNPIHKNAVVILALLVIIFGASAYYFFTKYTELKNNPNAATEQEVAALVAEVSKLILLPTDEQPTVATVADPEALKDQAFFANAQQDDKVLIYARAQKAILYSPARKQVIEVAPVNIGEGETLPPAPVVEETSDESAQ